jgi:hypothetical protein
MPNESVFTASGEEFALTRTKLRSRIPLGGSSYIAVDRATIIQAFEQVTKLLVPNSHNRVVVEDLAPTTNITVRKIKGYSYAYRRRSYCHWSFRYRGDGNVSIGCKVFSGLSAQAIRRWAKSAR